MITIFISDKKEKVHPYLAVAIEKRQTTLTHKLDRWKSDKTNQNQPLDTDVLNIFIKGTTLHFFIVKERQHYFEHVFKIR